MYFYHASDKYMIVSSGGGGIFEIDNSFHKLISFSAGLRECHKNGPNMGENAVAFELGWQQAVIAVRWMRRFSTLVYIYIYIYRFKYVCKVHLEQINILRRCNFQIEKIGLILSKVMLHCLDMLV